MIKQFFDEFFKAIVPLYHAYQFQYIESFVDNLLPTLEIEDKHIVKMMEIKLATGDSEAAFIKLIDKSIDKMRRIKMVREKSLIIGFH